MPVSKKNLFRDIFTSKFGLFFIIAALLLQYYDPQSYTHTQYNYFRSVSLENKVPDH